MRWSMAAVAVTLMGSSFLWSNVAYALKTYEVEAGEDMLLTWDPSFRGLGVTVNDAVQMIDDLVPQGATVAVLPEGASLNYWTRRPSSIPYISLMPPELTIFEEVEVLDVLRRQRPDFVVFLQRNMREYGVPPFGDSPEYGAKIMGWVREHYVPVHSVGGLSPADGGFRIDLLRSQAISLHLPPPVARGAPRHMLGRVGTIPVVAESRWPVGRGRAGPLAERRHSPLR